MIRKIMASHEEFRFLLKSNRKDDTRSLTLHLTPPPPDAVKLNVDGSLIPTSNCMGSGGLIRTHLGEWKVGFSVLEGPGDALLAELLAVKKGLLLACKEARLP